MGDETFPPRTGATSSPKPAQDAKRARMSTFEANEIGPNGSTASTKATSSPAVRDTASARPKDSLFNRLWQLKVWKHPLPIPPVARSFIANQRHPTEVPKAIYNAPFSFHAIAIHVLALATTAFVFQLVFRRVYFGDATMPKANIKLASLQFAVKAHETVLIASLGVIIVDVIRHALLKRDGIPLGLLISGYRPQFSMIWNPQLWSGLSSWWHNKDASIAFVFLACLFVMMLCAVVGPASGILLIPRLDHWHSRPGQMGSLVNYFTNKSQIIWPEELNADPYDCLNDASSIVSSCAAFVLPILSDNIAGLQAQSNINISVAGDQLATIQYYLWNYGASVNVAITQHLPNNLGAIFLGTLIDGVASLAYSHPLEAYTSIGIKSLAGQPVYEPISQVQCRLYDTDNPQIDLPHDLLLTPPLNALLDEKWTVEWQTKPNAHKRIGVTTQWVDSRDFGNKFSLGVVFRFEGEGIRDIIPLGTGNVTFVACTSDLRWFATAFSVDPTYNQAVSPNWTDPLTMLGLPKGPSDGGPLYNGTSWTTLPDFQAGGMISQNKRIRIDPEWAKYLDNSTVNGNVPGFTSILQRYINVITGGGSIHDIERNIAFLLAAAISHGLAAKQADIGMTLGVQTRSGIDWWDPAMKYTRNTEGVFDDFEIRKYGYVFGKSSATGYLAVTILSVYALLALCHTGWVIWTKHGSTRWSNIGEIVVLAMNSQPTKHLHNTCVGIDRLDSWEQHVKISETVEDQLELVFVEDDERLHKLPHRRKLYGSPTM